MEASAIGEEQVDGETARLAIQNSSFGNWHWLVFIKEDGWKLDLDFSDLLQKAELPTTKFDELLFDLLDFVNRHEK